MDTDPVSFVPRRWRFGSGCRLVVSLRRVGSCGPRRGRGGTGVRRLRVALLAVLAVVGMLAELVAPVGAALARPCGGGRG